MYLDDLCDELAGDNYSRFVRAKHLFLRWIQQIPELRALTTAEVDDLKVSNVTAFNDILRARVEDGTIKSNLLASYLQNLRQHHERP